MFVMRYWLWQRSCDITNCRLAPLRQGRGTGLTVVSTIAKAPSLLGFLKIHTMFRDITVKEYFVGFLLHLIYAVLFYNEITAFQ